MSWRYSQLMSNSDYSFDDNGLTDNYESYDNTNNDVKDEKLLLHHNTTSKCYYSLKTEDSLSDENTRSRKVGPPPIKAGVDYVNPSEEDQMEIYGYRPHCFRTFITWFFIVLTAGILRLVFHWKPHWMLICTHVKCSLDCASKVLLIDHYMQKFTENIIHLSANTFTNQHFSVNDSDNCSAQLDLVIPKLNGSFQPTNTLVFFENKKVRYLWDNETREFLKVRGLDRDVLCAYFYKQVGLSTDESNKRRILYGSNAIVVKVLSIFTILFQEVLEPFYIFQVFSVIIWCLDEYLYYATCIVIMSALSLTTSVIQTRRNQKQLRDTVQAIDTVKVCRTNDIYEEIESTKLVPGDMIAIPQFGCIMQCDAVLISGNVIVNESMLTGESVPVTKIPLPNNLNNNVYYHPKEHAKHTLFCGTKVIQTRYYDGLNVKAIIIRTGFQTAKGELVRSIMFPKPVDFKFNRHIHKFIACLAALAMVGFIYTVILKSIREVPVYKIILKALDLITIVIPPALPAAMTIGVVFAQSRLKRSKIFCISPRSINISGCINCVCFDKTGTLTEDDLNFAKVVPVNKNILRFDCPIESLSKLEFGPLIVCLASCHSLTIIEGSIIGDPLDQKMFEATEWHLEEPHIDETNKYNLMPPTLVKPKNICDDMQTKEVGVLRQFPFSSSLQRMSVITLMSNGTEFELYSKGAPEMISSLCDPNTIPEDFSETLMEYTEKGYRVLALAYRHLPSMTYPQIQRAAREDLEQNLNFLGLLIMGNMLKPETTSIIETLTAANIRTIMVTGDNMLTALSVARDCNMIRPFHKVVLLESDSYSNVDSKPNLVWKFSDAVNIRRMPAFNFKLIDDEEKDRLHVAITGKTFKILRDFYPDLLNRVAIRGTVFSRMAPEQKQQLIELLQELGYYVGMCGDGANDCGALKAAHAGVSLSETEASVASPFTSKISNISCVPTLIREGRASIVTSFGILKYMACYSMTQFISVIILYTFYSNLTDKEFLYQDLFLITLFVTLFGRTEAFDLLDRKPPPSSLIGITPLASLALQITLVVFIQTTAIYIVWQQWWYIPHVTDDPDDLASDDNYAIFASSVFQYITLAIVFTKGAPYRKPLFTNRLFLLSLIAMTALTVYLVVLPIKWLQEFFELSMERIPYSFRILMVLLAVSHFILAFFVEAFVVDYIIFKKFTHWFSSMKPSESPYKKIDSETKKNMRWLPNSLVLDDNIKEISHQNGSLHSNETNNMSKKTNDMSNNTEHQNKKDITI